MEIFALILLSISLLFIFFQSFIISNFKNNLIIYLVIIYISLFLIITLSSRLSLQFEGDDLIRYLSKYNYGYLDYIDYLLFSGREFFFSTIEWVIYQVLGDLKGNGYLAIFITIDVILLVLYFNSFLPKNLIAPILLLCLLTPTLSYASTQLIRQTLSFFLILFSLSLTSKSFKFLFLMMAFLTHYTSLAIYPLVYFMSLFISSSISIKNKVIFVFIFPILVSMIVNMYLDDILSLFKLIPVLGDKVHFVGKSLRFEPMKIGAVTIFSSFSLLLANLSLLKKKSSISSADTHLKSLSFFNVMFFLMSVFSSYNIISVRFSVMVTGFFPLFYYWLSLQFESRTKFIFDFLFSLVFILLFLNHNLGENEFRLFYGVF